MELFDESVGGVFAEAYADPIAESPKAAQAGPPWSSAVDEDREWQRILDEQNELEDEDAEQDSGVNEDELEDESPFAAETDTRQFLTLGRRGPGVAQAQTLLNDFLHEIVRGPQMCVDRSPQRLAQMRTLLHLLQHHRQLPLTVDGVFGPSTEHATQLFQSCLGLVRDGTIGKVTWQYLKRQSAPGRQPNLANPPAKRCGVPDRTSAELEYELELENEMLDETRRRTAGAVRARLSLYLNTPGTKHFESMAIRLARRLRTYGEPRADRCADRRVGPTAYETGADIVTAITAAHTCLGRRITAVHIFGHSGSDGVYGRSLANKWGLYVAAATASDIASGARSISDIPTAALANNVVVVLHGCNQASGSDSFAEHLYRHLVAKLTSPTVLGHTDGGCASRDESWIRFDSRSPSGRRVRSATPHYTDLGGCKKLLRREIEAYEGEGEIELASAWSQPEVEANSLDMPNGEWQQHRAAAARQPCGCAG